MPRPIVARISIAALANNLGVARSLSGGARVWAVVKAGAYGHGMAAAVRGFSQADGLALLDFDNAGLARELGWTRPILMLEGPFEPADLVTASALDLSLVVHDRSQLAWFADHRGSPLDVWLKVNSGMNRLGVSPGDVAEMHRRLSALPGVARVSLMTHFADADLPGGTKPAQARFDAAIGGLSGDRSLANSAAVGLHVETHADWVRPGIMLYGASPFDDRSAESLGLRPAMRFETRLIAVQHLNRGDTVGYGSTFTASGPMRIGIVACGYADGYPRRAPPSTPVIVDGVRTNLVGRVSMDMLTVDLAPVPLAGIGSLVQLWGPMLAVDEVARHCGTIGYELLCAVAARVPRIVQD
jgi:alanine racemase